MFDVLCEHYKNSINQIILLLAAYSAHVAYRYHIKVDRRIA